MCICLNICASSLPSAMIKISIYSHQTGCPFDMNLYYFVSYIIGNLQAVRCGRCLSCHWISLSKLSTTTNIQINHVTAVDCGSPTSMPNADLQVSATTFPHSAEYTCHTGYTAGVSSLRTQCSAQGNWEPQVNISMCEGKMCQLASYCFLMFQSWNIGYSCHKLVRIFLSICI